MKKVLIIGANSYIGKSLYEHVSSYYKENIADREEIDIKLVSASDGSWKVEEFSDYDNVLHISGIEHRQETEEMKNTMTT